MTFFLQNADNTVKNSFNSVVNLHKNTSCIYAIYNSFIELFMIFIKKDLKTIVCII